MKVCLAASAGGHLSQLLMLQAAWVGTAHFLVTTQSAAPPPSAVKAYVVPDGNRSRPWALLVMLIRCAVITLHERPDVVISTGAAVGLLLGALVRVRGGRCLWIDSVANVARLSLSGRVALSIANRVFVQWPQLQRRYSRAEYAGSVL